MTLQVLAGQEAELSALEIDVANLQLLLAAAQAGEPSTERDMLIASLQSQIADKQIEVIIKEGQIQSSNDYLEELADLFAENNC